jgi:hypothetical protein
MYIYIQERDMIYDYICTSDLCMYIVTRIIKKIETLFVYPASTDICL